MLRDLVDRFALWLLSPAAIEELTRREVAAALEAVAAAEARRAALEAVAAHVAGKPIAAEVIAVYEQDGRLDDAADLRAAIARVEERRVAAAIEQLRPEGAEALRPSPDRIGVPLENLETRPPATTLQRGGKPRGSLISRPSKPLQSSPLDR